MPDSPSTTQAVAVGVTIAASADVVFRFFGDPAWFARWMGDGAEIEPRPGGTVRVRYPHGQVASGQIVELDPPRRIVFTWGFLEAPDAPAAEQRLVPPGSMTVEVTLEPTRGGTRVTLHHRDIPTQDMAWGAKQGWRFALSGLANRASEAQVGDRAEVAVDAWVRAWSEPDSAARRTLLERSFAADGTFRDAFTVVEGLDELDERIATMHAFGSPGRLERSGPLQLCQGALRFGWRVKAPDGSQLGSGTNFAELTPAVSLRHVVGFWDSVSTSRIAQPPDHK